MSCLIWAIMAVAAAHLCMHLLERLVAGPVPRQSLLQVPQEGLQDRPRSTEVASCQPQLQPDKYR